MAENSGANVFSGLKVGTYVDFRHPAFLLGILLLTGFLCGGASAGDIPFRSIILGQETGPSAALTDRFEEYYLTFSSHYRDIYYRKDPPLYHDYHQGGLFLRALFRRSYYLIGLEAGRDVLTLENNNVHTGSDRLRGERDRRGGRLILGFDMDGRGPSAAVSNGRAIGSFGPEKDGYAGSLDGSITFADKYKLGVRTETFSTGFNLHESMLGYRFPFYFKFRTRRGMFSAVIPAAESTLRLKVGQETNIGGGRETKGFRNTVDSPGLFFSGSLSRGLKFLNESRRFITRTTPGSRLPGLAVCLDWKRHRHDISMYYSGTRYARIRDLTIRNSNISFYVMPFRSVWFFAGYQNFDLEHTTTDDSSFFEPWPFSVWNYFNLDKYILGNLKGEADIEYAGIGACLKNRAVKTWINARFEVIEDSGNYRWYNVEWLVPGTIPDLISHREKFEKTRTYALQICSHLSWQLQNNLSVQVCLESLIPFGREKTSSEEKESPSQPPPAEKSGGDTRTHGGLSGKLTFSYAL